jgi:hypothetical protein
MRRIGVIVALGALLSVFGGVATAAPALAGGRGDGWVFQDFGSGFTTTDCGFLIVATQTADKVFAKTATAHDGSTVTVFTGHAAITWSANGKSIATNTSGPFTQTLSADGLTLTQDFRGPTPIDLGPQLAQQLGLPALFVFTGHIVAVTDSAGNVISASMTGHMQADLCTALS